MRQALKGARDSKDESEENEVLGTRDSLYKSVVTEDGMLYRGNSK